MLQFAVQLVGGELQSQRMAELQVNDPAQFVIQRDEINNRVAQLQQVMQRAAEGYKQFDVKRRNDVRESELTALKTAVPDWGDSHKAKAKAVMKQIGFTDEEIVHIVDNRLIQAAVRYADLEAENAALKARIEKAKDSVRRVKKDVPQFKNKPTKGGPKLAAKAATVERTKKLARRFNRTKHVKDAAALIENLI